MLRGSLLCTSGSALVVATGVQNAVAAATTTTTSLALMR